MQIKKLPPSPNDAPEYYSVTYKERDISIFPVGLNSLFKLVSAQAEILIALNVPDFYEANEASFFHTWMGLVKGLLNWQESKFVIGNAAATSSATYG